MLAEAVDMKEAVKEEMERRYPNCRIQLAEVRKNNLYYYNREKNTLNAFVEAE